MSKALDMGRFIPKQMAICVQVLAEHGPAFSAASLRGRAISGVVTKDTQQRYYSAGGVFRKALRKFGLPGSPSDQNDLEQMATYVQVVAEHGPAFSAASLKAMTYLEAVTKETPRR